MDALFSPFFGQHRVWRDAARRLHQYNGWRRSGIELAANYTEYIHAGFFFFAWSALFDTTDGQPLKIQEERNLAALKANNSTEMEADAHLLSETDSWKLYNR